MGIKMEKLDMVAISYGNSLSTWQFLHSSKNTGLGPSYKCKVQNWILP